MDNGPNQPVSRIQQIDRDLIETLERVINGDYDEDLGSPTKNRFAAIMRPRSRERMIMEETAKQKKPTNIEKSKNQNTPKQVQRIPPIENGKKEQPSWLMTDVHVNQAERIPKSTRNMKYKQIPELKYEDLVNITLASEIPNYSSASKAPEIRKKLSRKRDASPNGLKILCQVMEAEFEKKERT
ncbi:unnamed protein product [Caenorhabditis bovis]|uniref:Uncharacterized protein n=1 Tax=Caenorhabditis bovis TaxID=2654633 RepID=A0A8S1FGE5_9PELO|nr:unnamed protein product [Caenorhabditis bovis]